MAFDREPVLNGGSVLVPMRSVFEGMGAQVSWDGETETVTAVRRMRTMQLRVGEAQAALANRGQEPFAVRLHSPARIVDGAIYVPLRFVGESFGADVTWAPAEREVII